jgi:hypothetical protein
MTRRRRFITLLGNLINTSAYGRPLTRSDDCTLADVPVSRRPTHFEPFPDTTQSTDQATNDPEDSEG